MKFIKFLLTFLIGLVYMLLGESVDVFRLAIFKYHGPEPKWYVWWVGMKARIQFWINWMYWAIGALVLGPFYLILNVGLLIWSTFKYLITYPFRRRKNPAIA